MHIPDVWPVSRNDPYSSCPSTAILVATRKKAISLEPLPATQTISLCSMAHIVFCLCSTYMLRWLPDFPLRLSLFSHHPLYLCSRVSITGDTPLDKNWFPCPTPHVSQTPCVHTCQRICLYAITSKFCHCIGSIWDRRLAAFSLIPSETSTLCGTQQFQGNSQWLWKQQYDYEVSYHSLCCGPHRAVLPSVFSLPDYNRTNTGLIQRM